MTYEDIVLLLVCIINLLCFSVMLITTHICKKKFTELQKKYESVLTDYILDIDEKNARIVELEEKIVALTDRINFEPKQEESSH